MENSSDPNTSELNGYLPQRVNCGQWINAYTLYRLRELAPDTRFVLPICSVAASYSELVTDDALLLPPLFHEALTDDLQQKIIEQIFACFPVYGDPSGNARRLQVVEYPRPPLPPSAPPEMLAFSVDTAVEEHGPHLPLGTDTIQSYSVLHALAASLDSFEVARPVEYGHLTWGLPFGYSVDLTVPLLTEYVAGYVDAIVAWKRPSAIYVVDVHGSMAHRQAIVDGLQASQCDNWAFRWLHEPLAEFASARGDQHAGGVETALVEYVSSELVDRDWFPPRESEIAEGAMTLEQAVELTSDLNAFARYVAKHQANGIVGDVRNYHTLDSTMMFQRMLNLARTDLQSLGGGGTAPDRSAGRNLW